VCQSSQVVGYQNNVSGVNLFVVLYRTSSSYQKKTVLEPCFFMVRSNGAMFLDGSIQSLFASPHTHTHTAMEVHRSTYTWPRRTLHRNPLTRTICVASSFKGPRKKTCSEPRRPTPSTAAFAKMIAAGMGLERNEWDRTT
jgi:hypothetical protein